MLRSLYILVLFYSMSFPSYAITLSDADKVIAVKYITSKSFPGIVEACAATIPIKEELYKSTLNEWLSANNEAISKGKEILNSVLHQDGQKESEHEYINRYMDTIRKDFSSLSESQKIQRCEYILEVLKNEQ